MPRRWKGFRREASEVEELDPFVLTLVARLLVARQASGACDDDWVPVEQITALSESLAQATATALQSGWAEGAEDRELVDRRTGPMGTELRLTRKGRNLVDPILA